MKRAKIIFLVVIIVILVALTAFFLIGYFKPKGAAISVESSPVSTVYINNEQVGKTPYESKLKSGEITVKLVPESFDKALTPYETKVELVPGITTVVRRIFADSDEASSGEIISFEKTGSENASLSVISTPDAAAVSVDATTRGFTPLKISSVSPGKHDLGVNATGFLTRSFSIQTKEGYRLTAIVKLAAPPEVSPSPSPNPTEGPGQTTNKEISAMIEILDTPTKFLRVRSEASTSGTEIARVNPGERFKLIETDEKSGWYKIEYLPTKAGEKEKTGWISNQYAKKISSAEVKVSPSPTPNKI